MSKSSLNLHHPYLNKLRKWRTPIFNFSLLCSLAIVTYAFNWTTYNTEPNPIEHEVIELEPEMQIVRTNHEIKRTPPPPVIKASTEVIPDDIEYDPEPEPESVIDKVIVDDVLPVKPVIVPAKPKAVPKAEPLPEPKIPIIELPFTVVEEMPRFSGCEEIIDNKEERKTCAVNKLLTYIYSQIKYPPVARENGIEGTVVIQFTIEKDGSITDINVLKEIGGGCGTEAARVVKGMPNWIPGKQRGKEVRVRYNLPVKYQLN